MKTEAGIVGGKPHKYTNKERRPRCMEKLDNDAIDEEISEDDAFNSDDERKYGCFFETGISVRSSKARSSDDDEEISANSSSQNSIDFSEDDEIIDHNDEHGDEGQYMLDLLNRLDTENSNSSHKGGNSKSAHFGEELEFSSSTIPSAGLTLETLMEGIKDTKGFGILQKSITTIANGKATSAPLSNVISERTKRQLQYKQQSYEVSKWRDAVQKNRAAETLDFRPRERFEVTRDVLIDKFVPTTDFEKEINAALEESGQRDEDEILKSEEAALHDDLGEHKISVEDYTHRQGQLAKMRALMFYHEQKRHYINKIKSKKYRRIRKNQREKQKAAETEGMLNDNPDLERELIEKEEIERMKERMTLAHRNTSKWAKHVLKRGSSVDIETRRALSAQLKRGDELLQRMNATKKDSDFSDDDRNENDLLDSARTVLDSVENEDEFQEHGLFKLAFMKKGIEKQREASKQEALQLLHELEANKDFEERLIADNDFEGNDIAVDSIKSKKKKMASRQEMNSVLQEGETVVSSIKLGNPTCVSSGSIDIGFELQNQHDSSITFQNKMPSENVSAIKSTITIVPIGEKEVSNNSLSSFMSKKPTPSSPDITDESNPWLISEARAKPEIEEDKKYTGNPWNKPGGATSKLSSKVLSVDVDRATELLENTQAKKIECATDLFQNSTATNLKQPITMLSQEQLVRKAFSTISEQEAEKEFAKEKATIEEQEDPIRKVKRGPDMDSASGWGSWTGAGALAPKQRKSPPSIKQVSSKRKREDESKPRVIISETRPKKLTEKFVLTHIPYPYSSREEYERSIAGGIGREWNVSRSFKDMIRPSIITRNGKIIQPISNRCKHKSKRPPAKF